MYCISIFLITILYMVESLRYSHFSKTNIIINSCTSDNLIKDIKVDNRLRCSLVCSQDMACRRYLYCESDLSCKTYHDGTDCILSDNSGQCSCFRKMIGCYNGICTCPLGYYGDKCQYIVKDCYDALNMDLSNGYLTNLLTYIQPDITPVEVVCMYGYRGTMAFMHRDNSCVFEDFNRTMEEYSKGFGPVPRNRWVGLVTMFHIMKQPTKHWTIIFRSKRANFFKTYYYNVTCQDATLGYELNFATSGHGGGGCSSCMQELRGNRFSTFDQDNTGANNCVTRFGGGWWFDNDTDCTISFLTGPMDGPDQNNHLIDAPPSSEPFMYLQIQLQRYL